MKAIVDGSKKFIHQDKVRHLSVPQYEGLGIKQMLVEAQKYAIMEDYLPDEQDWKKIPRQWLINLIYTLVGKPFSDWAQECMKARNEKLLNEQKLAIAMDPEILRCFNESTYISSKFTLGTRRRGGPLTSICFCFRIARNRRPSAQGRHQATPPGCRYSRSKLRARDGRPAGGRAVPKNRLAGAGAIPSPRRRQHQLERRPNSQPDDGGRRS